jgi:hypothetical protein
MAFGGGLWLTQNKILPGTYINFTSLSKASATLSDRGVAALPLPLNWGREDAVFEVTNADFQKNSTRIFGYPFDAPEMMPFRELFRNARTVFLYRLNGGTVKAVCAVEGVTVATALYGGSRGNDLKLVIASNVDAPETFDLTLYLGGSQVEAWVGVSSVNGLESKYIAFTTDAALTATAGAAFAGGSSGAVTGESHQAALDKLEAYAFNTLGCVADDDMTKSLYVQYTKRLRDEVGAKFQLVGHRIPAADYEGAISVENDVTGAGANSLIYWVLGAEAGCAVNRSVTNRAYDGELTVLADYTQKQLEDAVKAGKLILHNANGTVRVLDDVNTLITLSDTKGQDFQSNQTVRVCDQIANDTAVLFNTRYVGSVPNDASGRMSLWNDICKLIQELERIRAVENFDTATLKVEQGESKKAVLCTLTGLNITSAMAQLYMAVYIS